MIYPTVSQLHADVAEHYDDLDQWYLKIWGDHIHHGLWETGRETVAVAVVQLSRRVADRLQLRSGARVVDIGCGYGATARLLAAELGADVVGYTLSAAQYEYAVSKADGTGNPRYQLQDWLANDVGAGSVDAAISIESSEHMEDKPRFFSEAFRVLKPGGRMAICAWLAKDDPRPWSVDHLLEPICREGRLPSLGDEADYRRWFTEAGFTGVEFEDLTRKVKRTWPVIVGRMAKRLSWDKEARRYVRQGSNRIFVWTVVRMMIAYNTRTLRYGLFVARKPGAVVAAEDGSTSNGGRSRD